MKKNIKKLRIYKKPEIKIYADIPIAGGCGDSPNACECHSYYRQGGGCGDRPSSCSSQSYWK